MLCAPLYATATVAAAAAAVAGESDYLKGTIDYGDVFDSIKQIVEARTDILIETVANTIARTLLARYAAIAELLIRVKKPHVAVNGVVDYLGIEIVRTRADYPHVFGTGSDANTTKAAAQLPAPRERAARKRPTLAAPTATAGKSKHN
jgi:dihydroneopterin aldolase